MSRFYMQEEVKGMLRVLVCWGGASHEQLEQFRVGTANADAVLGPGATDYTYEIYLRGKLLSDSAELMKKALRPRVAQQPLRATIAEIKRIEMNWFTSQISGKEKPVYLQRLGL